MNKNLNELKELFEGATILEIKESSKHETIFDFFVEKNNVKYSFTLSEYEVGGRKNDKGNFTNFQDLLEEIFEHHLSHKDFESDVFEALDDVVHRSIGFRCQKCGEKFEVEIKTLKNSEYYELLNDVEKRKIFARILSEGWIENKNSAIEMIERVLSYDRETKF